MSIHCVNQFVALLGPAECTYAYVRYDDKPAVVLDRAAHEHLYIAYQYKFIDQEF